jgi:transcriptional regulator with XRE-family HTH domain
MLGRPRRSLVDKEQMELMGRRLRWVREAYGKKQQEMAEIVGIHQTSWSLYERGKRWPDQFEAVRLIAKLKITREYLLDGRLLGIEPELAIRIAARHPELVLPTCKADRTDRDRV